MSTRRKELTPALAAEWAQMAHGLYLEALMAQADWSVGEIAFHGGTSLRLSWNSTRYSEDLDFLLARNVKGIEGISRRIEAYIGEMARRIDANFSIEMKDKTKDADRMPIYMLSVSHPGYIGKAKIKAEFWRTDPDYLQQYPTQLRTPQMRATPGSKMDLYSLTSNPVPAATLETAYADKLTAFATRPFLKWRDLYDLWWIGTQTPAAIDIDPVCTQFLHNLTAYHTHDNRPPAEALARFLERERAEVVAQSDPDLRNWLPENVWKRMHPQGVQEIVDYVFHAIENVSAHVDGADRSTVDLKSVPRDRG